MEPYALNSSIVRETDSFITDNYIQKKIATSSSHKTIINTFRKNKQTPR